MLYYFGYREKEKFLLKRHGLDHLNPIKLSEYPDDRIQHNFTKETYRRYLELILRDK